MFVRQTTMRRRSMVPRRSGWKPVLLIAGLLAGLAFFLGGQAGVIRLWQRWRELHRVEAEAARLSAETDSLRQVLWLLENDLQYVEKVAREEYGMSKSSERIYRLRSQVQAPAERE